MRRRELIGGLSGMALAPTLSLHLRQAAAVRQDATPAVAPEEGSLADLLGLVPDVLASAEPPQFQIAQYANPALQLETLGFGPASADDQDAVVRWQRANWWTALPDSLRNNGFDERWREIFGFDVFQVDQSLMVGEPPALLTVYRGRFDPDELRSAWTASGYKEVDVAGADAYSIGEEAELDLDSEVGQFALAQMNNAAILPDGTLLFAPTLAALRSLAVTAQGNAPNLTEWPGLTELVAALDSSVANAILLSGEALRANPDDVLGQGASPEQRAAVEELLAEIDAGQSPMPRPRLGILAITAGGPLQPPPGGSPATPESGIPVAHDLIALLMTDRAAAETAIPIVENRLENGMSFATNRPYRDYFNDWTLSVTDNAPVLVVDLTPAPDATARVAFDMLQRRDLLFVGWRDENGQATPEADETG